MAEFHLKVPLKGEDIKKPKKGEILSLGDKVAEALKESGAVFNLDTHD